MDPVSLSASIAGLISLAGSIVSTCYSYGCAVKDGPAEVQRLTNEIMSLTGVLTALKALVEGNAKQATSLDVPSDQSWTEEPPPPYSHKETRDHFQHLADPLAGSEKVLKEVQDALQKAEFKSERRLDRVFRRMVWPLKREKTLELMNIVEQYKSIYILSLSTANAFMELESQTILTDIRSTQNMERLERQLDLEDAELRQIHQWLCPVNYAEAHQAARRLHLQGTGKWMSEQKQWLTWLESESSLIWLYGIPGSGKTVLLSTLLEDLSARTKNDCTHLAYFYCDFRDKESQRPERVLGGILSQLCYQSQAARSLLKEFANTHRLHGKEFLTATFEELQDTLYKVSSVLISAVIFIDALDECFERSDLARFLVELTSRKDCKIKVLVSSRQEADLESILPGPSQLALRVNADNQDIEYYISYCMANAPRLRRLPEELHTIVQNTLHEGCHGMFQWVQCQVEALSRLRTDRDIRKALIQLPKTLYGTYERILQQIDEQDQLVARRALLWLCYGPRAMTLDELAEAAVIEKDAQVKDLEASWDPQDVLGVIGSLARYYPRSHVVELAHHSVKEYLQNAELPSYIAFFHLERDGANEQFAEAMLTYLLLKDFESGPCGAQEPYQYRLSQYPMLVLSARLWPYYAAPIMTQSPDVLALSKRLLHPSVTPNFRVWTEVLVCQGPNDYSKLQKKTGAFNAWRGSRSRWKHVPTNLTPLYYAASFGMDTIVQSLIDAGVDVNAHGGLYGGTALHAAIFRRHVETAKLLIDAGTDLNTRDVYRMKPIHMAVGFRSPRKEIIDYLLAAAGDSASESNEKPNEVWWSHIQQNADDDDNMDAQSARLSSALTKMEVE